MDHYYPNLASMRTTIVYQLIALLVASVTAHASITLTLNFGVVEDSNGVSVADGTLWALVVDGNNDGMLAGMDLSNPTDSIANTGDTSAFSSVTALSLGMGIGHVNDQIFAMGQIQASTTGGTAGTTLISINFNAGDYNVNPGERYAILWFPGATYTGGASESIDSQVGGVTTSVVDFSSNGMFIPNDGFTESHLARSADYGSGPLSNSHFEAVVIPEPSALILGVLGCGFLLRRRRTS